MSGSDAKLIRRYAGMYSQLKPFRDAEEKRVRRLWEAADAKTRGLMRRAMESNRRLPQDEIREVRPNYAAITQNAKE